MELAIGLIADDVPEVRAESAGHGGLRWFVELSVDPCRPASDLPGAVVALRPAGGRTPPVNRSGSWPVPPGSGSQYTAPPPATTKVPAYHQQVEQALAQPSCEFLPAWRTLAISLDGRVPALLPSTGRCFF
jgi:hypothetical protein